MARIASLACAVLAVSAASATALTLPRPPLPLPLPVPGAPGSPAGGNVQPYGAGDYRGFRNVLPPGTNGLDDLQQLAAFEANKSYPPHANDQLGMYSGLTNAAPNIRASQIGDYFKDATFGVPSGDAGNSEIPEPGVTIVRDRGYGVPHIYGNTRAELMFGIGYATAEDRLFFIDVLRHAGRGDLASFAGGSNVGMDESVWASEPYTEQDLSNQVAYLGRIPYGRQVLDDAGNYVAGINAYIANAKSPTGALTMMPAEYAAIGQPGGPQPFSLNDLVAIATLVGGIFGNGGGQQLSNAVLYEHLRQHFGAERAATSGSPEVPAPTRRKKARPKPRRRRAADHPLPVVVAPRLPATDTVVNAPRRRARPRHKAKAPRPDTSGFATLLSFVDPSDPEAPTTVHGRHFPYQTLPGPSRAERATIALPDHGSVQGAQTVVGGSVPTGSARDAAAGGDGAGADLRGLLSFPRAMSNALLVSGAHSASGHPLAVMGPQVSYYTPQILMEEDIHGPGIDADGAAFPGVNLYVELGHGSDYAWSATSAGQNIIDTFAVPLCHPGGGSVSTGSNYYLLHGQCVPMETLTRQESWSPNLGDQTPAGQVTFRTERTAYGLVIGRARVHGRPVVYCNLRSTYMHELDSASGFLLYNQPNSMRNPQAFFNAASHIGYTFNWFYADDKHIAYFNSGQNPLRAAHTDPLFPSWASSAWPGYRGSDPLSPSSTSERVTSENAHPHTTDQTYLTSWNNQQALGYNDADTGQEFSSVYRSQLLDLGLNHYLKTQHGKLRLADVINAMGDAGTRDLRGAEVLPYALRILGRPHDPTLNEAVIQLRAWVLSGAHRINRQHPGASGNYDQSGAVKIMDAWWPLLVNAEFGPVLGRSLLYQVEQQFPINDQPGHGASGQHLGSAFDVGFYGIVQKDLRAALHQRVSGKLNRVYCGNGSLVRCRAALTNSLRAAVNESAQQVYPADKQCAAGNQMCSDSIEFKPVGSITQPLIEWINRPTFQQADEIQGHGPR